MNIDSLNETSKIKSISRDAQVEAPNNLKKPDFVSISLSAKNKAKLLHAVNLVNEASDVRQDKIEQAKINLQSYLKDGKVDDLILETISHRISSHLF